MTDGPDPLKPNLAETTGPGVSIVETDVAVARRSKEAYFTAFLLVAMATRIRPALSATNCANDVNLPATSMW